MLHNAGIPFGVERGQPSSKAWRSAPLWSIPANRTVQSSLWKYCHEPQVLVRRLKEPFTPKDGVGASDFAKTLAGNKYAWTEVLRSKLVPQTEPKSDAFHCSAFVGFTINAATGFSLYGFAAHRPLHPLTISEPPDLMAVNLEWRPHTAGLAVALPASQFND